MHQQNKIKHGGTPKKKRHTTIRHQDLTINHILESWSFANTTARNAAGSYVSADIGRIGFQQDTGVYWRLTGTAPNWQKLTGNFTTIDTPNVSPTGTSSSAAPVMMGLNFTYTPVVTGKVVIFASGGARNTDIGANGGQLEIWCGLLPAPTNGAAVPAGATLVGPPLLWKNSADSSNCIFPYTLVGIVINLTLFTTYWVDISMQVNGTGTINLFQNHFSLTELP